MAKKSMNPLDDKQLAQGIVESANQIWLAGLAAFEKAQAEGSKVFDTLVKQGEAVEARSRKIATNRLEEAKSRVQFAHSTATGTVDKLEQVFQDRVSRSLRRLGVPTRDDIDRLTRQVEELNQLIQELTKDKDR
jgi:poly(hydroxyalkanoate) granule-associated protein